MQRYTIKDFIDAGYVLAFNVNFLGRYSGMIYGKNGRLILTSRDFKPLKKHKNIYNLLKRSNRFIKISGKEGHYILQMLDLHYEGPNKEISYYLLQDFETDSDIDRLLEKYDESKKETNVNRLKKH